jgi:hypothetical protein
MILSVHVPKAAGNSFRECLAARFGERMMGDYGDWAGFDEPTANARRAERVAAMRARGPELQEKYDIIHGHFVADKYEGLFPTAEYVAFFRDPYQQTLAHYYFLLRNPQRQHPEETMFHEAKMTLHDYLEWDAFRNHQSQYLGKVALDDFTMVGLSAHFRQSLSMFGAIFDCDLGEERFFNVNDERTGEYEITLDVKRAIEKNRALDIELYRRAQEIFAKQAARIAA